MKIVDESNPMPKYLQISVWLKELIKTKRYKAGEKLPSEVELSELCGVHRNTLRQAISELTSIGLVRKERGIGTFIADPAPVVLRQKLERIASTAEMMQDEGITQYSKIIGKKVKIASDEIAAALHLGSSKKVIIIRRVRIGNGTPYIYEESHLPYDLFKEILKMDLTGSMYKIFSKKFNIVLARSKQSIGAVNLDSKIAKILQLPVNSAGIFMESITFNQKSIPMEVLYSYHRGDKYKLEIELGRYDDHAGKIQITT
jgi:GntR family transcriptional regulator